MGFLFCFQLVLEGPDDVLAFEFCPSDPNIIVGGCINGQVLAFTLKQESAVSCAFVGCTRKQIEVNNSSKMSSFFVTYSVVKLLIFCCCCSRLCSGTFLPMSQSYRLL